MVFEVVVWFGDAVVGSGKPLYSVWLSSLFLPGQRLAY